MRLTLDDIVSDDLERRLLALTCTVYLDGVKVQGCVMADEEKGEVELYDKDTSPTPATGYTWPTKVLKGKVEIRPSPETGT